MAPLRDYLTQAGFTAVSTYIASGNVILRSDKSAAVIKQLVEDVLRDHFSLDSDYVEVLVLSHDQLRTMVDQRPTGFGEQSDTYHSDAIFLMGIDTDAAMTVFNPKEGVDAVWPGQGIIYSQRLSALRTKSRLGSIVGTPVYKSMTIRNWNTTTKLLELLDKLATTEGRV
jgi:uncharacterized protein (DUF1697 family)